MRSDFFTTVSLPCGTLTTELTAFHGTWGQLSVSTRPQNSPDSDLLLRCRRPNWGREQS